MTRLSERIKRLWCLHIYNMTSPKSNDRATVLTQFSLYGSWPSVIFTAITEASKYTRWLIQSCQCIMSPHQRGSFGNLPWNYVHVYRCPLELWEQQAVIIILAKHSTAILLLLQICLFRVTGAVWRGRCVSCSGSSHIFLLLFQSYIENLWHSLQHALNVEPLTS